MSIDDNTAKGRIRLRAPIPEATLVDNFYICSFQDRDFEFVYFYLILILFNKN